MHRSTIAIRRIFDFLKKFFFVGLGLFSENFEPKRTTDHVSEHGLDDFVALRLNPNLDALLCTE